MNMVFPLESPSESGGCAARDLPQFLSILLGLEKGAEERKLRRDPVHIDASHGERLDPVEKLARGRFLSEAVYLADPVKLLDALSDHLLLDVGIVYPDDAFHHLFVGKLYVIEDAPPQE